MYRQDAMAMSLEDGELLERLKRSALNERKIQAQVLAYLAVVDQRRLYAVEGYSHILPRRIIKD